MEEVVEPMDERCVSFIRRGCRESYHGNEAGSKEGCFKVRSIGSKDLDGLSHLGAGTGRSDRRVVAKVWGPREEPRVTNYDGEHSPDGGRGASIGHVELAHPYGWKSLRELGRLYGWENLRCRCESPCDTTRDRPWSSHGYQCEAWYQVSRSVMRALRPKHE